MNRDPHSASDTYTLADEPFDMVIATETPSPDPQKARRTFSRVGFSLMILALAMMVAQVAVDFLLVSLIPDYADAWWRSWVLSLVPLYGVGLPFMILSLRGVKAAPHNTVYTDNVGSLEKPRFTLRHFLIIVPIAFACMYIGSYAGNLIMLLLSSVTGYDYANGLTSLVDESPLWMTLFGTCVCAPLGEEFIFRKLLIDRTRRHGDGISILLSGLLFGLFHGNLFQFFYAALLGMFLAYLYTRTNNLWWCVALHGMVNLMGGVVMPSLSSLIPEEIPSEPMSALWILLLTMVLSTWIIGMIVLGSIFFAKFRKKRKLSQGSSHVPVRGCFRTVFANPGMIAAMIVMGAMMLMSLIPA